MIILSLKILKMVKFYNFSKHGENGDDQIKKFFQICDYLRSSFTVIALSQKIVKTIFASSTYQSRIILLSFKN